MNTPAHILFGGALFGRPGQPKVTAAACFGGIAPDLSLYIMGGWSLYVLGIPPETVFRDLYFSPAWQQVFAIDNSFIIWGLGLGIALWAKAPAAIAFAAAGLLHLALDFPFHTDDARMHFWPLTTWRFESPVSYWDGRAYGNQVGAVALALAVAATIWVWRRFRSWTMRIGALLLLAMEASVSGMWRLFFAG
ncbi:MAG: cobalamin biosynthesis protein CobQ [Pseudomonadota bacterium]